MQQNNIYREKLFTIVDKLPDFCSQFLLETQTERAVSTRYQYALDIDLFFDYLISYHPYFAEMEKKQITAADLKEVTPIDINRFLSKYGENHAERTIARKKASISSFFSYLCNTLRVLDYNPIDGAVRISIHPKDYVTHLNLQEQETLMNSVIYGAGLSKGQLKYHEKYQKRDTALIYLFLDTGMRISEITGIDIRDLDLDECSVIVQRKGGKIEKLYYSDTAMSYLMDYLDEKSHYKPLNGSEEPLFTTLKGARLSIRQVQELVEKYVKAALPNKMERISPHKLRSSFAMEFYRTTNDMLLLQKKLGHANIYATNIYAKATNTDSRDSRNLLQNRKLQESKNNFNS